MDYCADLPAIEARLAEYRLPAASNVPAPLREDLRACLDGEAGRQETLVDRARRCLAQDPLDADAARLVAHLGSDGDAPLLAPGLLVGGLRLAGPMTAPGGDRAGWHLDAPLAVGPLVQDLERWGICVRGAPPGWLTDPSKMQFRPYRLDPPPFDRVAWRTAVLGDSEWQAAEAVRQALVRPLLHPADRALLEDLAAEPWRQRGRLAREHLYATALNQWPVPEVVVTWARRDVANPGSDDAEWAAGVLYRAGLGPRPPLEQGPRGFGAPDPTPLPGAAEMAALRAAPRPRFPGPAVPVTDADTLRVTALARWDTDRRRALFLLGFVARPDDLDRIAGQLGGPFEGDALQALARIRTDRALDLLEQAAAAPDIHRAQGALAATRTERGWVAALASWKGRTDLTMTHTTAGCALPLILWDAGVRAYLDPDCVRAPSPLRDRVRAAAAAGQEDATHAIGDRSPQAFWRARAALFDPDPAIRAKGIEALLADPEDPAVEPIRRSLPQSPLALAAVVQRAAEDPELVRALAPELREVKLVPELRPAGLAELLAQLPPEEVDPFVAMMRAGSRDPQPPPYDPAPSLARCLDPATAPRERLRLMGELARACWEDALEPCLRFAIREAPDDELRFLAGFVERSIRLESAWIALTERLPTASPTTAEALRATFVRVGLPPAGLAGPRPLPRD